MWRGALTLMLFQAMYLSLMDVWSTCQRWIYFLANREQLHILFHLKKYESDNFEEIEAPYHQLYPCLSL